MPTAHSRFGPLLVFLAGLATAVWCTYAGAGPVDDGFNRYDPRVVAGVLAYCVGVAVAMGWIALRPSRIVRWIAGTASGFWALIAAALLFDLTWHLLGPGVQPMPNTCRGGMDCIGEVMPGAPLTGDGSIVGFLAVLSIPFVAPIVLVPAVSGREHPTR